MDQMGNSTFLMEIDTKESGSKIVDKVKADCIFIMVVNLKVYLKMMKFMMGNLKIKTIMYSRMILRKEVIS